MLKGKHIKPGDLLVTIILLIASFVPFYTLLSPKKESNSVTAIIKVNNRQVKKLPLDHDVIWKYRHGNKLNVIQVKDHKIKIIDANCKDQICVKEGWKSKSEETIVCLPHKFLVELKDDSNE